MYEAPDGPPRPYVGCRHSTGRCGEILQHEVQRCYLLKRAALVGGLFHRSSPKRLFTASGWKPSRISGTVGPSDSYRSRRTLALQAKGGAVFDLGNSPICDYKRPTFSSVRREMFRREMTCSRGWSRAAGWWFVAISID